MVNPDIPIKKVGLVPVEASVAAGAVGVVAAGAVGVVAAGAVGVVAAGAVGVVAAGAVVKFRVVGLVIPVKALSERSRITPLAIST
jgi:hypothetical protein